MAKIDRSEITPEHLYLSRRKFIKGMGALVVGAAASACLPQDSPFPTDPAPTVSENPTAATQTLTPTATPVPSSTPAPPTPTSIAASQIWPAVSTEQDDLGDKLTAEAAINGYNNFYEFSFGKEEVRELVYAFETEPWSVEVSGLVENPTVFTLQDLLAFTQQERIYRMRCVEGWSMVIPWIGFPLAELLAKVGPTSEAQYVYFETVYRPEQMPGQARGGFPWPYVEGLRLDEAQHDLTILATGLYGKQLRKQTGAPIRLVVPWKYGFKSIKSIAKIELVAEMPTSTWMAQAPHEYGFYANVNPDVPHPRWSQATERRIGETKRRETLLFNGYDEVAELYKDLDLSTWY
jgi:sulfoxide reductase catalytic subunit YedY